MTIDKSQVSDEALRAFDEAREYQYMEIGGSMELAEKAGIAAAMNVMLEPACKQFYDGAGRWHGFVNQDHENNTIASGEWPIRQLFSITPGASQ